MTAEAQATLAAIEAVNVKIDALLRFVTTAKEEPKPGLSIRDAAKRINRSERYVALLLQRGELRKVKGRIPHSALVPFLS